MDEPSVWGWVCGGRLIHNVIDRSLLVIELRNVLVAYVFVGMNRRAFLNVFCNSLFSKLMRLSLYSMKRLRSALAVPLT
jgi:hypothetical protein